jgi:hypothetical protein
MATSRQRTSRGRSPSPGLPPLAIGIAWLVVLVFVVSTLRFPSGVVAAVLVVAALGVTLAINRWVEQRRWSGPLHHLAMQLATLAEDPSWPLELTTAPELRELGRALSELRRSWLEESRLGASAAYYREMIVEGTARDPQRNQKLSGTMTRSGMLAAMPSMETEGFDPNLSGDFSTTDMVNRLEPKEFRWIESSPAEQDFLGWDLPALREQSFLDLVHPQDRARAEEQIGAALEKAVSSGSSSKCIGPVLVLYRGPALR